MLVYTYFRCGGLAYGLIQQMPAAIDIELSGYWGVKAAERRC